MTHSFYIENDYFFSSYLIKSWGQTLGTYISIKDKTYRFPDYWKNKQRRKNITHLFLQHISSDIVQLSLINFFLLMVTQWAWCLQANRLAHPSVQSRANLLLQSEAALTS